MPTGYPVEGFPIKYEWQEAWVDLFDKHVDLIRNDIKRARAEDRVIVYLSCPISARGGGYHGTNVEIAKHTERRLLDDWGHRFWILNPAQYQMESKEGTGLIKRHAELLTLEGKPTDVDRLMNESPPTGGDYMRMWTRVLVVDGGDDAGRRFDAFYFIGPTDVRDFFSRGGAISTTAGIEEYFARKFTMDPEFRDYYSKPDPDWEKMRKQFFRFYAIRASANFSKGCHDEWNIFQLINQKRLAGSNRKGDIGELLAGYFDGRQIDPGAAVTPIDHGYAIE